MNLKNSRLLSGRLAKFIGLKYLSKNLVLKRMLEGEQIIFIAFDGPNPLTQRSKFLEIQMERIEDYQSD